MAVLLNKIYYHLSFLSISWIQNKLRQEPKKVKASTLVEVLVASVLIIVIFAIASLSLNNVFKSAVKGNTSSIENELNKLQYLYQHQKINDTYQTDFGDWEIRFLKSNKNSINIELEAINIKIQQKTTRQLYDEVIR